MLELLETLELLFTLLATEELLGAKLELLTARLLDDSAAGLLATTITLLAAALLAGTTTLLTATLELFAGAFELLAVFS